MMVHLTKENMKLAGESEETAFILKNSYPPKPVSFCHRDQ